MHDAIIALLQQDMRGEHQAIIQYLFHAYYMEEGKIPAEVEAIAREEMRHFKWLAEAIVELGGKPTLEREPPDLSHAEPPAQLRKDVDLEQMAIDQYRAHIEAIDDPKIRRLLARILHDELVHKGQFADLADEAEEEHVGSVGEGESTPGRLADILNEGVRHEYTVVLQYLYHSFLSEGKEMAEELEDTAINEMQHLGWLAEALAERGGEVDMSHSEVVATNDPEEMLEADVAVEREVTRAYSDQIPELEDEELSALVERIRDHEIYHDAVFTDMLAELREEGGDAEAEQAESEEDEDRSPPPSVGSLIGR